MNFFLSDGQSIIVKDYHIAPVTATQIYSPTVNTEYQYPTNVVLTMKAHILINNNLCIMQNFKNIFQIFSRKMGNQTWIIERKILNWAKTLERTNQSLENTYNLRVLYIQCIGPSYLRDTFKFMYRIRSNIKSISIPS